ncbi:MAG: uroporphyrinogen-III C-methyltransferase, partial [Phycisphaerales bacterium]
MRHSPGTVYLIGAGPGDAGLITVRGRQLLEYADVILHDRLISGDLLVYARPGAEVIDVGKVPGESRHTQEDIHATLIDRARRGRTVIRLKGGDPLVFGRGWEEWRACRDAAVPCIVVPGVTSAVAAPAAAGIPVTHRGTSRTFAVTTARTADDTAAFSSNCKALAKVDTVAILMGRSRVAEAARAFVSAGRDPATPAACIEQGTTPWQRSVVATLETIAEAADRKGLRAPVVTVIGEVARCADEYKEYLDSIWTQCAPRTRRGGTSSGPTFVPSEPLAGKRIVITRSHSSLRGLRRRLLAAGASTIEAPMIRVEYPEKPDLLDAAIRNLKCYDWIAFSSVHGVRGFFERLRVLDRDVRALASCKVA